MDIESISNEFPIFKRKINGHNLIYLDSASTSQKPTQVINSIKEYYEKFNSNVHRGVYKISEEATLAFENSRSNVASLINSYPEEIIFTSGTTKSINMLANILSMNYLKKGDEIIITEMEHHSNLVPWQIASKLYGLKLKYVKLTNNGSIDINKLESLFTEKTKLITITHVSNVLGTINPIKEIAKIAHKHNSLILVDGAQSVPHMTIDVKSLDIDFLAFSGHKMLASTGIGILYGKKKLLESLQPSEFGGGMISNVSLNNSSWNESPWKFEAGTPNVEGAISLSTAISYLKSIGLEKIEKHEKELTKYTLEQLEKIENIKVYGPSERSGIISFNINKLHPHDISAILDREGIAIRGGHHCAMPLMKFLRINGTARISFYLYNSFEDIDKLIKSLKTVSEVLK
ncbi:cysteine desulfurase [Candidatus Woesearchaeota archaeon]|nr:cysteine desulfurase [Candidatus Woesearchaeota archaeon]